MDKVAPILERNIEALKAKGIKEPRRLYRVIKEMGADQQFTFPDGAVIRRDDVVGPDKRGRVLVFCGDTADASSLLPLLPARGADVVVHEATNCRVEPYHILLPYEHHHILLQLQVLIVLELYFLLIL